MTSLGIKNEQQLLSLAAALGASSVPDLSSEEKELLRNATPMRGAPLVRRARTLIGIGQDPLGDAFCEVRSPTVRRSNGATYTPRKIIRAMVEWAARNGSPARVVDPGAGSGRFLIAAGRKFPHSQLVGIEIDPVAAILLRANLSATGLASRTRIVVDDYRNVSLDFCSGQTLFVGNPPYVRHHSISKHWKEWLVDQANARSQKASQLAGLHIHFFLQMLAQAEPGDYGVFITAAEWLDVNYGALLRNLFLAELGGQAIHVIEPKAAPFPDATTTAAVTCFRVGTKPATILVRRVHTCNNLGDLTKGRKVHRDQLGASSRWTQFTRIARRAPEGFVELGELCRVHRGQVTGANKVWIAGPRADGLPASVLFSAVTRARELIEAGDTLDDTSGLRNVIDLPADLDTFDGQERIAIDRFLTWAKLMGADMTYIARNRSAWWSVGLYEPAPILCTYMARRPPAFVRNFVGARHINIAHGIYPRESMTEVMLARLIQHLSTHIDVAEGRTYAGGLTKFEPREMERVLVPSPDRLAA